MAVPASWRKRVVQFRSLGVSRIALILGIVFCLLALVSPMWSATRTRPGNGWLTITYTWTTVTYEDYAGGVWQGTTVLPYTSQNFDQHAIAGAAQSSFLLVAVLAILLFIVVAIFSTPFGRTMPRLGLLVLGSIVVVISLLALFYPVATVPSSAAADFNQPAITGFWGSAATGEPASWGAGLGWYSLLIAVILGCLGAALPYLQNMRALPQMPTRAWPPPP